MATFQKHWITPGAAVFTVHGPKVALLRLLTLGLKTTNVEYLLFLKKLTDTPKDFFRRTGRESWI